MVHSIVLSHIHVAADVLRWGKTYWQAASEHADRPKVDVEVDAKIEGSLAAEASLIVLDTLEMLVQTLSLEGQAMLGHTLEVLLHLMGSNQSTEVMRSIFATQRAIVNKFPELVFEEETELCAELCTRLLRHCSSSVDEIRALACSSLYLLMRQNFELGNVSKTVSICISINCVLMASSLCSDICQGQSSSDGGTVFHCCWNIGETLSPLVAMTTLSYLSYRVSMSIICDVLSRH